MKNKQNSLHGDKIEHVVIPAPSLEKIKFFFNPENDGQVPDGYINIEYLTKDEIKKKYPHLKHIPESAV